MKNLFIFLFAFVMSRSVQAQQTKNILTDLLQSKPEWFGELLKNRDEYQIQILYTQIDRDNKNKPSFKSYSYGLDANRYFYPASTVKFPASLLALEKINRLKIKGLTRKTPMLTGATYERHTPADTDSTSATGLPSVEHYIKKILLVSDNDAYNRLYEFVGQQAFNESLYAKGYQNARIVHRLEVGMTREQDRRTNPIKFVANGQSVYEQAMATNEKEFVPKEKISMGKAYYSKGKLVEHPMDFTYKNYYPIQTQQDVLKAVLFPESLQAKQRFDLTKDDYRFLYQYMSQLPTETNYPHYPTNEYWPSFCKFLMYGSEKEAVIPKNIRIFNKVGDAYGFLIDNAYIVDFDAHIEFMLSAVIYVNEDKTFNDDKYEYDTIGFPFFKHLGQVVYEHELSRKRKNKPDLSKFKVEYEKR